MRNALLTVATKRRISIRLFSRNGMLIEDRARIRLLGPRQEALIVALDETHSAINQLDPVFAKIFSHLIEESLQRWSWDVNLRDHLCRGLFQGDSPSLAIPTL
jgi:hypothetical protein